MLLCFCLWMWACSTWDGAKQTKYGIMHACSAQLHCRKVVMVCAIIFWALCYNSLTVQHAVSACANSSLANLGGQDFPWSLTHTYSFWSQPLSNSLSTLVCDSFVCDSSARRRGQGSYTARLALAPLALARHPRSHVAQVAHVALSLFNFLCHRYEWTGGLLTAWRWVHWCQDLKMNTLLLGYICLSLASDSHGHISSTSMWYKTFNTAPNVSAAYCFYHLQYARPKISYKSVPSAACLAHIPQEAVIIMQYAHRGNCWCRAYTRSMLRDAAILDWVLGMNFVSQIMRASSLAFVTSSLINKTMRNEQHPFVAFPPPTCPSNVATKCKHPCSSQQHTQGHPVNVRQNKIN